MSKASFNSLRACWDHASLEDTVEESSANSAMFDIFYKERNNQTIDGIRQLTRANWKQLSVLYLSDCNAISMTAK